MRRRATRDSRRDAAAGRISGRKVSFPAPCEWCVKIEVAMFSGSQLECPPSQIRKGHWGPFCARVARLTLCELQQIAAKKGGQCLSLESANSSKLLRWRCVDGHEWQARAHSIRAGRWCPA